MLMQDLRDAEGSEQETVFKNLARFRVLSTQQLATLLGISRQATYVKLMRHKIDYASPPMCRIGTIDPSVLDEVISIVTMLRDDPNRIRVRHVDVLKQFGPVGVVEHLTGFNTSKGTI